MAILSTRGGRTQPLCHSLRRRKPRLLFIKCLQFLHTCDEISTHFLPNVTSITNISNITNITSITNITNIANITNITNITNIINIT